MLLRQMLELDGEEGDMGDQGQAPLASVDQGAEVDASLREMEFEGDVRTIATVDIPTNSQMEGSLDEMDQRDQKRDSPVLSWSGKGVSRGAQIIGNIPPGSNSGVIGFEEEIVKYARCVHSRGEPSKRGMSTYGERHIEIGIEGNNGVIKAGGIQKEDETTSTIGEIDGSHVWGMSGSEKHPPTELHLGHEVPERNSVGKGVSSGGNMGEAIGETEREIDPSTPIERCAIRKANTGHEQNATPGRGKRCWETKTYSDGEHFRGTYGPTTFSTPKAETKEGTSMTSATGGGPIHYHIGTPDTWHPPKASSGGTRYELLLGSRIDGLEGSLSQVLDTVNGHERKSDEMLSQLDKMRQEISKLSTTMAAMKAEIKEEKSHRTNVVDEVKRAESHWNGMLERAVRAQEATLGAENRTRELSERVIRERVQQHKSLGSLEESVNQLKRHSQEMEDRMMQNSEQVKETSESQLKSWEQMRRDLIELVKKDRRRRGDILSEVDARMGGLKSDLEERVRQLDRKVIRTIGEVMRDPADVTSRASIGALTQEMQGVRGAVRRVIKATKEREKEHGESARRLKELLNTLGGRLDKAMEAYDGRIRMMEERVIALEQGSGKPKTGNDRRSDSRQLLREDGRPGTDEEGPEGGQQRYNFDGLFRAFDEKKLNREIGMVQGEIKALREDVKALENRRRNEEEAIRKEMGEIRDENRKLQDFEQRLKILEKGHANREVEYERWVEKLEKEKSEMGELWMASERRAVDAIERIGMLETEAKNREKKLIGFIEDAKDRMGGMVSEEREKELLTRIADLEKQASGVIEKNAAPCVGNTRPQSPGDFMTRGTQPVGDNTEKNRGSDGASLGENTHQRMSGEETQTRSSTEGFPTKAEQPSKIDDDVNEEEEGSGMNWCEDIRIGETTLTSHTLYSWIAGVAQAARVAYLYDPDYAYWSIAGVLQMSEADRGKPLFYPALENKLYRAIRDAVKPNTPEMNAITTLEMREAGRLPPTALQLMYVILDRVRIPQEDEVAVFTETLLQTYYWKVPGKREERSLEEFLARWDMALDNLRRASEEAIDSKRIARLFRSKIRQVNCLTFTIEKWEELSPGEKTYERLRDKVDLKLKAWRQDNDLKDLYGECMRDLSSRGYVAAPAQRPGERLREAPTVPQGRGTGDKGTALRWGHEGFA